MTFHIIARYNYAKPIVEYHHVLGEIHGEMTTVLIGRVMEYNLKASVNIHICSKC